MAFTVSSEISTDGIATITLVGALDALAAPVFMNEINKVTASSPTKLVLIMADLTFMASAGLRVLIFARQSFKKGLPIYVVKAQPAILESLQLTGIDKAVYIVDEPPTS